MGFSLSAVMFAYNEAAHLEAVIRDSLQALSGALDDYELIVVNDGSTDGSADILSRLAEEFPALKVLTHDHRRGIGEGVHTGYAQAARDYICILPADGQVSIAQYTRFFPAIEAGADMVMARYEQRGDVDGLHRMVLTHGLQALTFLFFGVSRKIDGAFLFRRSLLDDFSLTTRSFFVNLELPIRVMRGGHRVEQRPMAVHARISGQSKVLNTGRIKQILRDVGKLRLQLWRERWQKT